MDLANEKILITGAAGFIGSHLTEYCVQMGYHVRAFDLYSRNNDWGWLEHVSCKDDIEVVLGDIREYDSVYNAMKGCTCVLHLAALVGIPYSYISPLGYIRTNFEGTYNILECARHLELNNIVVTSTSETYGSAQYVPIDESHPIVGQSPYSASKIGADQLAISYHRSFNIPIKIIRPFNVYGPRQSSRAVIPTIISQILNGSEEIRLGNIFPTRDLTFVRDTVRAFAAVMECETLIGETVNVGMNEEISIGNLAEVICELMCVNVKIAGKNERVRPAKSEVNRLVCDNSKLIEYTGWVPEYNLRSGLCETIEWIKLNINSFKPEFYNV